MTEFKLEKGKHFTPTSLVNYLNNEHVDKLIAKHLIYGGVQKMAYNVNDIHQYILRSALPDYLGKNELKEIHIPFMGNLKIIELTWL